MEQLAEILSDYGRQAMIVLTFLAVVVWIYRPGAEKRYKADGNIPFYGDRKQDPKARHRG